jgi:hypothetical protein
VVISLLLAPTVAWLAARLNLPADDDAGTKRRVRTALALAALDRLEQIEETGDRAGEPIPGDLVSRLRRMAQEQLNRAAAAEQRAGEPGTGNAELSRAVGVEMMRAEQEELLRLRDREGLPDEIVREMQREIDVRIRALGQR